MFYYPNVLQRHTGCFSTVWLAATKGSRIVKREYLKVNVMKTCHRIVQYILQQVPAPYHGSPIPRLSLYLSAQLSYGVVCVYHRQCDLLIEEMKTTLDRLFKAEKQTKIDLIHTEQHLLLPDNLILMQMSEDAPDPFFGMMEISPELPEPMMIPQLCMLLEASGPEIIRLEKTPPRHSRISRRKDTSQLTSPETITIQEVEPVPLPSVEFGQDLPEVSPHDLELLVSDLPSLPEVETLPEPRKRRIPGELDTRKPPKDTKDTKDRSKLDIDRNGKETEGEKHLEEAAFEPEHVETELHKMEKEIELLKKEKRQSELQWQCEKARERKEEAEREEWYQREIEREMGHLRNAVRELKRLQITGATEELLLEKQMEIKRLKKYQHQRQRQWEAEKLEQQLKEEERLREYLKEQEKEQQKLREAEEEIEKLKKALTEKDLDEKIREEPDRKMRKIAEQVDEKRTSETEGSPVISSPKTGMPSDLLDATVLLDEVTGQPMDFLPEGSIETQSPLTAPPHVSPKPSSPQLMLPEEPFEGVHLPPARRSLQRSSLIVDKDTQIVSKTMQEQTCDPLIYTQSVLSVAVDLMKSQTPASLFESPTYQTFMAPELLELWSRCALLEPLQFTQEREEELISEPEEMRAGTESGVSVMFSSEFSLEMSEEERSRPILLTPEDGRSLSGQEDKFLPMVSEMPEVIVELPETQEVLLSDMYRKLHSEIDSAGRAEFLSLTPGALSRFFASRFFFNCLVLCTQQVIRLEQTEPYGRILITPGSNY
ncbi:meiotic recombination protein REC8 homolog [Engystomops pustulosus]|uniref:meiotic recombination protein REC8 homolog n=1 Tax=Engystomops pustulosus TaxID=76066 RepID=UPI003AFB0443